MTFKAAVKVVLQYLLNAEIARLAVKGNNENDLSRKIIINAEIAKIKELSDKLDDSK
jgi:hypothetical protein